MPGELTACLSSDLATPTRQPKVVGEDSPLVGRAGGSTSRSCYALGRTAGEPASSATESPSLLISEIA